MTVLKDWLISNTVGLLLALLAFLFVLLAIQTVRIDGLKLGPIPLWIGLTQRLQESVGAKEAATDEREARDREGETSDLSYTKLAQACREASARARTSGRVIAEVTDVQDPDSDGGVIRFDRLRDALGQPAPAASPGQVPGGSDQQDAGRAPNP